MPVSELSRSRPAAEPSQKRGIGAAIGGMSAKVRSSLGKVASFIFTRALLIFVIGFAAGMAWQVYGNTVRTAVAGWSPHLSWIAPSVHASNSRDRLRATSVALAAVRQSVDKLANEVDKLQDQNADQRSTGSGSRRSSQRH